MPALSKEGDRFKRVDMLIDVATKALRIKFDQLHPPETLQETLRSNKCKIIRHISRNQENILYPKTGTVSSQNMGLGLMLCVLQNTGLEAPHSTFDCKPHKCDISVGADVARMKFYRNEFAHTKNKELNEKEFEEISQTLIEVIRRFSGPLFDHEIKSKMEDSLDYHANFTWHVHMAINAFNEKMIQLYENQSLHHSFYVFTVLAICMTIIFQISSI